MTFYGLGYHKERERWITKEWFWYQAHADTDMLQQQIYFVQLLARGQTLGVW